MALATLDRAIERFTPPIYTFHQIVHNATVVARYEQVGVIFIDDVRTVPRGATLVFSAHGVSPEVRRLARQRDARIVDATCPLVHKVHTEAKRFARNGRTILLIGHRGHDETVGITGEAPENIRLVETVEDAASVRVPDPANVAWLTQTTLSVDETARILDVLRQRFPEIEGPSKDDICYATQNRQEAVRDLVAQADLVLVLGSRNSSNSQRLAELGRSHGVAAHLLDGPDQLDPDWFAGTDTVVISAGASVPEELVAGAIRWITDRFDATVEERSVAEETMRFQLPVIVRDSASATASG